MTFKNGLLVPQAPEAPRAEQRRRALQEDYMRRYGIQGADWASMKPPTANAIAVGLRRARRSAPGPDGLGAKAWLATLSGVDTLAEALEWQLDGMPMRQDWNFTVAVFPAKGSRTDDPQEVLRKAGETRPLALENTSKKAIMWSLNACMKRASEQNCVDTQRGFLRGRNFCDNIAELDTSARIMSMQGPTGAAAAAPDGDVRRPGGLAAVAHESSHNEKVRKDHGPNPMDDIVAGATTAAAPCSAASYFPQPPTPRTAISLRPHLQPVAARGPSRQGGEIGTPSIGQGPHGADGGESPHPSRSTGKSSCSSVLKDNADPMLPQPPPLPAHPLPAGARGTSTMDCDLDPMQQLDEYDGGSSFGAEDEAMMETPSHPRRVATTMEGDLDPMADAFLDDPDVPDGAFDEISTSGICHLVQAPDLSGYRPDCVPGVDLADIVAANSEAVHVVVAWLNNFALQLEMEAMQARRKSFANWDEVVFKIHFRPF